jgi:hypothetical protein
MLFGSVLINRCTRQACAGTSDLFRLPDKVLEQIAVVLGKKEDLCLLNNCLEVANKLLALS